MNFKEWWQNKQQFDTSEISPVIMIESPLHLEQVLAELQRLGFYKGNDFSKHGTITNVDIWYAEFYNLFITYTKHESDFLVTLEELREIQV